MVLGATKQNILEFLGWAVRTPEEPTELHTIFQASGTPKINIVFIHGLDGDAFKTWNLPNSKKKGASENWFDWIVNHEPRANIYSLKYRLRAFGGSNASMPLNDRAINVLAIFESTLNSTIPTLLICHSYGGLVAKQMMRTAYDLAEEYRPVGKSIKGIVFFGTPHFGARIADYVTALGKLVARGPAIDELKTNGAQIRELSTWFKNQFSRLNIKIAVFYEGFSTGPARIVDETSSDPGIVGVTPIKIDCDHVDLPRPSVPDQRVRKTLAIIREISVVEQTADYKLFEEALRASDGQLLSIRRKAMAELKRNPGNASASSTLTLIDNQLEHRPRSAEPGLAQYKLRTERRGGGGFRARVPMGAQASGAPALLLVVIVIFIVPLLMRFDLVDYIRQFLAWIMGSG